jgi:2-polyprenyl-6-methoxyphenol hydroxylase-like FAD-dependent oxidoreductase
MRVLVIGAGLGGLCLAQGLRRAGIEVTVCERDSGIAARLQGYRIVLTESGLVALRASLSGRWFRLFEATIGNLAGERPVLDPWLNRTGGMTPRRGTAIDRQVLRHLLLTGLDVHFGAELVSYRVRPDRRVEAAFSDGATRVAEVLVGADGISSSVRRTLTPQTAITDTGARCVIGRTPLTERFAALVPGFGTVVKSDRLNLLLGLMRFGMQPVEAAAALAPEVSLPYVGDYLRWVMMLPAGHPVAVGATRPAQDTVLELIQDWHPELWKLVEAADPDNSTLLSIRVVRPERHWAPGPVTLLGDAIHATAPSGGNGANTALHDANRLRQKLVEVAEGRTELLGAIADYEHEMLRYGAEAVEHSLAMLPEFMPAGSH